MPDVKWTCPRCKVGALSEGSHAELFALCDRCGFVFPHSGATPDETQCNDLSALADSNVARWAEVCADRYRVIRTLGAGAQGRILLARHRHLDQPCVIKLLMVSDDEWKSVAAARLRAEARAGFAVNHANVARVFDCDCVHGSWYFVMEYVEGFNLRRLIHEMDRLSWQQVSDIGIQTAEGLAAIHRAALIHRDIKPGNLMLGGDGILKIMDLGLVKIQAAGHDNSITMVGQMLGTPFYMPPEQFDADADIDFRADLYALGATLYHLSVGRPPYTGNGVLDLAQKHRHDPVVWPDEKNEKTPEWLRRVIEACLAKRPDHRYESAGAVAQALRAGLEQGAASVSVPAPSPRVAPRGVSVLTFRNLSRREEDDWIGDAIADYVTTRLIALRDVHIADRGSLRRMLKQHAEREAAGSEMERIVEAGRLVGASTIILGSYQSAGGRLRIAAHALIDGSADPQHVTDVVGAVDDLFALEDQIAGAVVEMVSKRIAPTVPQGGGTESLEATEKLVKGKRVFADGDYREAIRLAQQAHEIDPAYLDPISLMGVCYARCGEYDKAVEYHQREEDLARALHNQPRLAEAYGNLGVMYYYQGAYALAFEFLDKAKSIAHELNLSGDAAKFQGNLGFVLMRLNRYDEAERAFAQAIEISKRYGDLVSLVWPYNGMGSVLLKQERYTEAREYYSRALALADEIGDRVNVGVSHMNLGRCACLMGNFAVAQAKFDEALRTLEGTDFWNGLTLIYEHLAEMHLLRGKVEEALSCIDQRIDLARRHHNNRMEAEGWEQKARAFELMENSDEALRCLKRSIEISQRPPPYESLHRYLEEVSARPPFRR